MRPPTGAVQARIRLRAGGDSPALKRAPGRGEHIDMKNTATEKTDDTDWTDFHGYVIRCISVIREIRVLLQSRLLLKRHKYITFLILNCWRLLRIRCSKSAFICGSISSDSIAEFESNMDGMDGTDFHGIVIRSHPCHQ